MSQVREIIQEHPEYGYRRILPELEERTGRTVNHKRLRRLLNEHELALLRQMPKRSPSPVEKILEEASGSLNLVKGHEPGPLEAFSTDFTEVRYANGNRKAHLMAVVDLESKYACGWAVGPSANRELALHCWNRVREQMRSLDVDLNGRIIHHDQDSVYTSYQWLRTILLEDSMRVSYSENGAKGNRGDPRSPGSNHSGGGRRPRSDHRSPRPSLCLLCERSWTSASATTTRSGGTPRSGMYHRKHLNNALSTCESEPRIIAASYPKLAAQLVQKFGHPSQMPTFCGRCFGMLGKRLW